MTDENKISSPMLLVSAELKYPNQWHGSLGKYSKQIMTGLEGNRRIYLPREIQDLLPNSFY